MFRWLTSAAGVTAALGLAATSAGAMTISLGTPSLSGRVAISEPVTVSCAAFDPSLVLFGQSVTVSAEQASGRSVAHGSVTSPANFACDGSTTTIPVTVLADPSGPPFHGGGAAISASAQATAGTPCPFAPQGCFTSPFENQNASAGPTTLNLH